MADVYDTLKYDASNTLNLTGTLERSLQTFAEPAPGSSGVPAVAHTPAYLERMTWKGCVLSYANFNTLRTAMVSTTAITATQATWPAVVVQDQSASPPAITSTTYLIMWAGYSNVVRLEDSAGPAFQFDFHCWVRGTPGTGFDLTLEYSEGNNVVVHWCQGGGVVEQANTLEPTNILGSNEYALDKVYEGGRTINITGFINSSAELDYLSQLADRDDGATVSGGYMGSFTTRTATEYYVENFRVVRQYHGNLWKVSFTLREENEPT